MEKSKHPEDKSPNQSIKDSTQTSNCKSDGGNTNQAAKAKRKVFAKPKNEQKRNPVEQDFANKQLRVQVMTNKSQTKWREEGKVKATGSGGKFGQK